MRRMNALELMNAHCDALFVQNDRAELVCVNDWLRRPAPAFWLGFTPSGVMWRFRHDVPTATRARIESLAGRERPEPRLQPDHHDAYREWLGAGDPVAGPTLHLPRLPTGVRPPDERAVRVTCDNDSLLRGSALEAWHADVPHQQPMFAAVVDGRAVAVCASVRATAVAHEAGVETLCAHRRRGHAVAIVSAWAREVQRMGVVPLYSTSWDNAASRAVARRSGFAPFGWEYRIG